MAPCQGPWTDWPLSPPSQGTYGHSGVIDRSLMGGWKEVKRWREEEEARWCCGPNRLTFVPADVVWRQHTNTHTLSLSVTYGPHVDQASAQERVQAPLYAGQAGDVEHLVPHARREQEEEVQQPVPHFILRLATALEEIWAQNMIRSTGDSWWFQYQIKVALPAKLWVTPGVTSNFIVCFRQQGQFTIPQNPWCTHTKNWQTVRYLLLGTYNRKSCRPNLSSRIDVILTNCCTVSEGLRWLWLLFIVKYFSTRGSCHGFCREGQPFCLVSCAITCQA